jgi:hypothetical protein
MKKLFIITLLFAGTFTACNTQTKEENSHQHDDGSTHADHEESETPTNQEQFNADTLKADTVNSDSTHSHDGTSDHKH